MLDKVVSFTKEDFRKYSSNEDFERIVEIDTIPCFLDHIYNNYKELNAICKDDSSLATFADLYNDINKVAKALKEKGIKKGDNVGVLALNSYQFACFSLATMAIGAIACLIPAQLDEKVVFGLSKKFELRALLYQKELEGKTSLLNPNEIVIIGEDVFNNPKGEIVFDYSIEGKDPACIIMTGGTTGKSKGAVLPHEAIMAGTINGCYGTKDIFNKSYYAIIPLTHVFGFIRNLMTSLYTGSLIYFNKDKKMMFQEIQKAKPEVLVIVPALAELFLNLVKAYGLTMIGGKVKHIICGGASVPPYLITEYHKLGINFCAGYGLTEFSNMVSGNPEGLKCPESVGMLFPNQEAKIVDGELWLKGKNMMIGYYKEEEENKNAFCDGWFKTGDLARFDEENNLYIIGRIKDIIVLSNGENVSPAYIESKVNELPYIQDSLVTDTINERGAEVLQVEVVLRASVINNMGLEKDKINEFVTKGVLEVNEKLLDYEKLSKVVIRDKDFDRTPAMKIIRPKKVF